jgi:hypothetical protein
VNLSDLKSSKYLKRSDVGPGVLVTIQKVELADVAREGAEPEMKPALWFDELDKPMVLNSTNGQIIANITGQENDIEHNWLGTRIVLYDDPNVSYGGKLVGGIRVRAPKQGTKLPPPVHKPVEAVPPIGDNLSGLPF